MENHGIFLSKKMEGIKRSKARAKEIFGLFKNGNDMTEMKAMACNVPKKIQFSGNNI
jgi:hypothetical protein